MRKAAGPRGKKERKEGGGGGGGGTVGDTEPMVGGPRGVWSAVGLLGGCQGPESLGTNEKPQRDGVYPSEE